MTSKTSKKNKKKTDKSEYYVDPEEMKNLIVEYYKTDIFSEELGCMLVKISEGVRRSAKFIQYTYADEFISEANWKMVNGLIRRTYDPEKGNPFSYFSKTCERVFINVIKKEQRIGNMLDKYASELTSELTLNDMYFQPLLDEDNYEED